MRNESLSRGLHLEVPTHEAGWFSTVPPASRYPLANLGWTKEDYHEHPHPPSRIRRPSHDRPQVDDPVYFRRRDGDAIWRGQAVYQRYGLMDHGSVWGHGSLRGMDFSAQTLHLVGRSLRKSLARERYGKRYTELDEDQRTVVDARAIKEIKENTYDPGTGELRVSPAMATAIQEARGYWDRLLRHGDRTHGFLPNTVKTAGQRRDLGAFFYWTGWAAGVKRPAHDLTYTNN